MKAAIEYTLMFMVGCLLIAIMMQFASVITMIHKGHLYLNYITHLTNNYDGNLMDVSNHSESQKICSSCTYTHSKMDKRYEIEVIFPVDMPVISFASRMRITGITQAFE